MRPSTGTSNIPLPLIHLLTDAFHSHLHTSSTLLLYSYPHSLSAFFFRILCQTQSPVYTTSPLKQPSANNSRYITNPPPLDAQQFQPFPLYPNIHSLHHTIHIYIKQPWRQHTTLFQLKISRKLHYAQSHSYSDSGSGYCRGKIP